MCDFLKIEDGVIDEVSATLESLSASLDKDAERKAKQSVQMTLLNPFAATQGSSAAKGTKKIGAQVMQWQQKQKELKATNVMKDEVPLLLLLCSGLPLILSFACF